MKDVISQLRISQADKIWQGEDPNIVIASLTIHRILAGHAPREYCPECPYREITDSILAIKHQL